MATSRVRKRQRLDDDEPNENTQKSVFSRGAVIRMHLRDFMTYNNIEIKAGPYLNMVLGPNGTGKSALVCGLIVGLAGEASATGRSNSFSEYIRFGCLCAVVEIELYNHEGDNYVIQRKLISHDGKCRSEWRLNDRVVKKEVITQLIDSLNIKVTNLCQFLPQERVIEFVKMNKIELLENTEKAVGDEGMFNDHTTLKKLSQEIKELGKSVITLEKQLVTDQQSNERMAELVEKVKEREKEREEIEWLHKKKPWIEFEAKRNEYVSICSDVEILERELKEKKSENEPLVAKIATCKNDLSKCEEKRKLTIDDLKSLSSNFNHFFKEIEENGEKVRQSVANLDNKKKLEAKRVSEIRKLRDEIVILEQKLESVSRRDFQSSIDEVVEEISVTLASVKDLTQRKRLLEGEKDTVGQEMKSITIRLSQLQDVFRKRMTLLQRLEKRAYDAAIWLERNRNRFKGKIFPPIMTQINVKNIHQAKYVEQAIPFRDLTAFVVEEVDDLVKFTDFLQDEVRVNVNVVQAPDRSVSIESRVNRESLSRFGFIGYVKDLMEAPDAVLRYLCKNCNINNIPVGDGKVDLNSVLNNTTFTRFFFDDETILVKTSRYDGAKVRISEKIRDPRCLTVTLDGKLKRDLEEQYKNWQIKYDELNSQISEIDEGMNELNGKLNEFQARRKKLMQEKEEGRQLEVSISAKKDAIVRKEADALDLKAEETKLRTDLEALIAAKMKIFGKLTQLFTKSRDLTKKNMESELTKTIAKKQISLYERKLASLNADFVQLENEVKKMKDFKEALRIEAKRVRIEAQKAIDMPANQDQLPKNVLARFKKLPDTLQEVDNRLKSLALRMEVGGVDEDLSVLEKFDSQKNAIKRLKSDLESKRADISVKKGEIEMLKKRWLPPLKDLIDRINLNFSKFMSRLGCAGEVSLINGGEDDFETYGISVKVKYRESEQLQELTASHQSGGERSVATMIYMIALQELTKVPFRVVDEINQGMDDNNERRVFDLIVETATHSSSQYFLFSPKLLPGLKYTERMHIHVIFNGPHMDYKWKHPEIAE